MSGKNSPIGKDILRRVRWLYAIFLVAAALIFARIVWIQYGPRGDELRQRAREITFERRSIPAGRGDILARDGRILSTTVPEYEIRMDFNVLSMADSVFARNADTLSQRLAELIGDRPAGAYRAMLADYYRDGRSNQYARILPRRLTYAEEQQASGFPIFNMGRYKGGYIRNALSRRFMPVDSLARSVVGTVGDTAAVGGLESSYDRYLRGTTGNSLMQKISGDFWVPVPDDFNVEPVNGFDIVTTLDADLQDLAAKVLREKLVERDAYWGTVILMEVATGEIRAMCNLTRQGRGRYGEIFNHAIRTPCEPGSTFKLASLLALVENGGMSIRDIVDCSSDATLRANVGGRWVRDDHRLGRVTLKRAFEESSNIGFARAVYDIYRGTPNCFVDYVKSGLGFGERTGIDLPAERAPQIAEPGERGWNGWSLQMMSYGYGFEVTALQTLMLYNAVANDGRMMRPMLVRAVTNYGDTVERFEPAPLIEAIASPGAVRAARESLEGVVDEGTGQLMQNAHYRTAAKTGTSQQVVPGGGYIHHDGGGGVDLLATFVGYFPAGNPKYSCIVAIKARERGVKIYGSSTAGPVFRAIADRVYALSIDLHDKDYGPVRRPAAAADVKGGRADRVAAVAEVLAAGVHPGDDGWWRAPAAADTAAHVPFAEPAVGMVAVPGVVGMGLRDALYLMEEAGLRVSFSGAGRVVSQSAREGETVAAGTTVTIKLAI